jgi:uncharacterized protein (DUF2235 family)
MTASARRRRRWPRPAAPSAGAEAERADIYRYACQHREGDDIYIFGFSRGAHRPIGAALIARKVPPAGERGRPARTVGAYRHFRKLSASPAAVPTCWRGGCETG